MIKIIDNFLNDNIHKSLESELTKPTFPENKSLVCITKFGLNT